MPLRLTTAHSGWYSRELIDLFERLCEVLFIFAGRVKYWILVNQIKLTSHESFNLILSSLIRYLSGHGFLPGVGHAPCRAKVCPLRERGHSVVAVRSVPPRVTTDHEVPAAPQSQVCCPS